MCLLVVGASDIDLRGHLHLLEGVNVDALFFYARTTLGETMDPRGWMTEELWHHFHLENIIC
jgi:hypothetical protein